MAKGVDGMDFRFGSFNIPNHDDMVKISEGVKKILNSDSDDVKKQKTTYSISPLATTLIKEFAEECGVTQGGIVELAPLLFRVIASESIKRRKQGLPAIKTLIAQIKSNLNSIEEIAPQLKPYIDYIGQAINELMELECTAVKEKNYKGVDPSNSPILSKAGRGTSEIAFHKDVKKILRKDKNIEDLFNNINK